MKISEKDLVELYMRVRPSPTGDPLFQLTREQLDSVISLARLGLQSQRIDKLLEDNRELMDDLAKQEETDKLRLISLGLWAQEHAVPFIEKVDYALLLDENLADAWDELHQGVQEARAALPRDVTGPKEGGE